MGRDAGTCGRWLLRTLRSAAAAAECERCPPAPASPPPRPGDARAPAHLRGSAPPPARFPRAPWRFRTCESGRSAAQKMDAGGWARTPRSAPGAGQARRPLDLGCQRAGLRGAAGRGAPAPPAPPPQSQARPGLRGHRAGPGTRAQLSFNPAPNSENRVSPVLSHGCQGTPGLFPTMV